MSHIIAARIKEQIVQIASRALNGRKFTRTDLAIGLKQSFFNRSCTILGQSQLQSFIIAEEIKNFLISAKAKRTKEDRDGHFPVLIDTNVENIIQVCLVFKPCTSVRNNLSGKQFFTALVTRLVEIDTG